MVLDFHILYIDMEILQTSSCGGVHNSIIIDVKIDSRQITMRLVHNFGIDVCQNRINTSSFA
jgi:hypothetical protein